MTSRVSFLLSLVSLPFLLLASPSSPGGQSPVGASFEPSRFPAHAATNVNPDTRLVLTFPAPPTLHNAGEIRIYDASNDELVDLLDMSIPPGPKNTRTPAPYDSLVYDHIPNKLYTVREPDTNRTHRYQINYIGGETEADAYHFYPVLINGNTVTIHPHNNRLAYGKRYYVQIDPGVFSLDGEPFAGYTGSSAWTFTTKGAPPAATATALVVAADGTGDFNTVQGALDFIPDEHPGRITVFVRNGRYEEIVYFRNKENVTLIGEDREGVLICYANNGVFNNSPHQRLPTVSYHNTRSVFALTGSKGIHIANMTIRSLGEQPAQAEALLVKGDELIVSHVNIEGSGDAPQATGNIYITDSKIQGFGDNVLGYGAVFFRRCDFVSTYGPHMWIRNSDANHGNVCIDCTFRTIGEVETTIARTNDNGGSGFPYCEAVLINCAMEGIRAEGWSVKGEGITHIHYWEYNSVSLDDGQPIDMSERNPIARQLTMEADAELIRQYSDPAFVLEGWQPAMAPFITAQPQSVRTRQGEAVTLAVQCASIEAPTYQWFKEEQPLPGATAAELHIAKPRRRDEASYFVLISNGEGSVRSEAAVLRVE
ncbi:MAG: Ig-like domain-containing protein [Lewinella sp.]|nr:Ig-like domain-containing protein [Lewinella sp.]